MKCKIKWNIRLKNVKNIHWIKGWKNGSSAFAYGTQAVSPFREKGSGCYKCVGELPEGSLIWHVLVNLIEMPSATLGTAGGSDLCRSRSLPRLTSASERGERWKTAAAWKSVVSLKSSWRNGRLVSSTSAWALAIMRSSPKSQKEWRDQVQAV